MKSQLAAGADPQADFAATDLAMQIKALFESCPNLCGFVVEDLSGLHGDAAPQDAENRFVITQVSLDIPCSESETHQVCAMIASIIAELAAEQAQTYELLRNRTFARTLH